MRGFCKFIFIAILFSNTLLAQERSNSKSPEQVSEEEWANIVDYLNAEVTAMAMLEYKNKKKGLNAKEETALSEVSLLLIENSIENPVSFSELKNVLNPSWAKTLKKISTPIDSLKNYPPRVLDSLFIKTENILVSRKSKIGQSAKYQELKNNIIRSQLKEKTQVVARVEESKFPPEGRISPSRVVEKKSFYSYWMIPSLILLVSTVMFFVKWRNQKRKNKKIKAIKTRDDEGYNKQIRELNRKLNNQDKKNFSSKSQSECLKDENSFQKNDENSNSILERKKSPVIDLTPSETIREPKNLFSGKPTIENKFSNLTNTPISNKTIYKLTIHDDGLQADFEVDLVDDFITREVTNAPDEYLYRVCNQENSNKNFSREIITVKPGLAVLIDGDWTVQEGNKATIKFQ